MNYSPGAVQPRLYNYSIKTRISSRKVSIYPLNALQSLPWNCKSLRLPKGQWEHRPPASLPSWVRTRNLQRTCNRHRELQRSPDLHLATGWGREKPSLQTCCSSQCRAVETSGFLQNRLTWKPSSPLANQVTLSVIFMQLDLKHPHLQNGSNDAKVA